MENYQTLAKMVDLSCSESRIRENSNLQQSLRQILETGMARTGKYTGSGRFSSKVVWTKKVSDYLNKIGIEHVCGNDAPRGGAIGEFVRVTDLSFLDVIKGRIAKRQEEEKKENELARLREEVRNAYEKKASYEAAYDAELHARLKDDLHGDARHKNRKSARKAVARVISEKYGLSPYGVDFVMTQADSLVCEFINQ